jgi:tetratricopeptide (TPR) repeat protein
LKAWWVNQQGQQAFRAGDYRKALQSFQAARKIAGDDGFVRFNEGTALLQLRRYRDAEAALQDAVRRISPKQRQVQAAAYYNLGNVYFAQQRWEQAAQAYIAALKRTPDDLAAKINLELVLRHRQQNRRSQSQRSSAPPPPPPLPPPSMERDPLKRQLQRGLTAPWHGERDW